MQEQTEEDASEKLLSFYVHEHTKENAFENFVSPEFKQETEGFVSDHFGSTSFNVNQETGHHAANIPGFMNLNAKQDHVSCRPGLQLPKEVCGFKIEVDRAEEIHFATTSPLIKDKGRFISIFDLKN